jgi:hypothetical protein
MAVNNPKGHGSSPNGEGFRRGVLPGEGAIREVAAFVLDHDHFAGVPPTAMVTCQRGRVSNSLATGSVEGAFSEDVKVGSLQQFVVAEGDCEERGPSAFPADQVHKIAVLDMRLANTDRNAGNILVRRTLNPGSTAAGATRADVAWELVPIDHGYCLPSSFQDISFEWLYWPQAKVPFSERTLSYIRALDADRDLATLTQHGLHIRPECQRVLKVATMLLQKAAARGMTPFQIGSIMCREASQKSAIEKLHAHAVDLAAGVRAPSALSRYLRELTAAGEDSYYKHMSGLLDEYLDESVLEELVGVV